METPLHSYIKADDNKVINEKAIRWIKKIDECLAVCTRTNGCSILNNINTHKICKSTNYDSYMHLIKYFD